MKFSWNQIDNYYRGIYLICFFLINFCYSQNRMLDVSILMSSWLDCYA
uniref:Uncharacterized protein n=1 Tax=Arundo donax TaxID=35708 RepID=A0A0A9F647_ARUDO